MYKQRLTIKTNDKGDTKVKVPHIGPRPRIVSNSNKKKNDSGMHEKEAKKPENKSRRGK